MKHIFTLLFITVLTSTVFAQQGFIRGTIIEDATGETLIGVTIYLKGTTTGTVTDFDGAFQFKADPGIYDVQVSYVSYETMTISGVEVKSGETTLLNNIRMKEAVEELAEVIITADVIKDSEAALLTVKKKSAVVMDGISSESFKKIGDSDAASAAKRITGVSIEGGKYVFVRGLGDRYTKTILNGMDIPGLDPDRNTLQMDIFPTNVINNIVVKKSFSADLSADFTGGIVDLETKDFPEQKTFDLNLGIGYNPGMHFNSNFLTYNSSGTDWLGFDNGLREIPTGGSTDIPVFVDVVGRPSNDPNVIEFQNILGGFNQELAGIRAASFMDYNAGLAFGNQVNLSKMTIGYNISLSYKNDVTFYENAQYNRFGKAPDRSQTELDTLEYQVGDVGNVSRMLGGMAGIAFKFDKSKYSLNILHLQNGESRAGQFTYLGRELGSNFDALQHNLEYNQRALTNIFLNGSHYFGDKTWEIDWRFSPTFSKISDPDIRFTRFRTDRPGNLIGTESGLPERIWRDLEEQNLSGKVGTTFNHEFNGAEAKLKFGGAYTFKERDFNIQNFQFSTVRYKVTDPEPNNLLSEENLWEPESNSGMIYNPNFIPRNPNEFNSIIKVAGFYISEEFNPFSNLKAIIGLRAEKYDQIYTGTNQLGDIVFDNESVLDEFDLFPTANLIYSVTDNQNIRFSYSRTIARPSFKELSYAEIFDPVTGRTFIGGLFPSTVEGEVVWDGNLQTTLINNIDLRWETFQKRGQLVSFSIFAKQFDRPIEIVQSLTQTNTFQPRNVGDGFVLGGELELRQSLNFISPSLENLLFSGNLTVIESRIDMSETEILSRENGAREGESVSTTRNMAGQSPWIVNAGLSYNSSDSKFDAGLFYNVKGETLLYVGAANVPDVYSVPFHSLNLKANYKFGETEKFRMSFKIENILNDDREEIYKNFEAADRIFTSFSPMTSFSVGLSYSFL